VNPAIAPAIAMALWNKYPNNLPLEWIGGPVDGMVAPFNEERCFGIVSNDHRTVAVYVPSESYEGPEPRRVMRHEKTEQLIQRS